MLSRPLILLTFLAIWLPGAPDARADDAPYRRDVSISYRMISSDTFEETYTNSTTILSEGAIGSMSQSTLSLNEHFSEWLSVEGVNIKADGRVLTVPAEQILLSSAPNSAQLGVFEADVRKRTIVFPAVEVGDVLTFSRTIRTKKANVPGGFDAMLSIPPHARYGDVRIEMDAPSDMRFAVSREGFKEEVREEGGRRLYVWSLPEQPHVAPESGSVSFYDYSPFVALSNRESDEAIGRWFYSVASEKAAATKDISKIANEVTAGLADRREQARAIYDYVSSKIRYFHIMIGQGGWVPHAASAVLANGFGDCKDHVTLMRAMLGVKGIAADYVLVNASSPSYRAFDVPLARYDHVILYLPEFGVYADPTNALLAFGAMPREVAGKPVLHISAERVELRRAPELQASDEAVSVHATIRVAADGRYSGETVWEARANQGKLLRRQLSAGTKSRAELMADWLQRSGISGKGAFDAGRASDHAEPFRIAMKFETEMKLFSDLSGRPTYPMGPLLIDVPHTPFLRYQRANRRLDTLCYAQNFEITIDIELHESLTFGPLPLPVRIETEYGVFSASYVAVGKRLRVTRAWRLQPPTVRCSRAVIATHIEPLVNTMSRDNGMRLGIQRTVGLGRPN